MVASRTCTFRKPTGEQCRNGAMADDDAVLLAFAGPRRRGGRGEEARRPTAPTRTHGRWRIRDRGCRHDPAAAADHRDRDLRGPRVGELARPGAAADRRSPRERQAAGGRRPGGARRAAGSGARPAPPEGRSAMTQTTGWSGFYPALRPGAGGDGAPAWKDGSRPRPTRSAHHPERTGHRVQPAVGLMRGARRPQPLHRRPRQPVEQLSLRWSWLLLRCTPPP